MSAHNAVFFLVGLAALIGGAHVLVRGASRLAGAFGVSPLVIGLTVVAFGTSTPELGVSVGASLLGEPGLAVGNVIGSNIADLLLILGICALIRPLTVARRLIRFDVPVVIGASLLAFLFAHNGRISPFEGAVLLFVLAAYTTLLIRQGVKAAGWARLPGVRALGSSPTGRDRSLLVSSGAVLAGLLFLALGAKWVVDSVTAMARALGVSELIVGLTVVAVGTSLPEIATSVVATIRREYSIALGNVIGSCAFNVLGVLGFAAVVRPSGLVFPTSAIHFDFPVMLAASGACLIVFFTGQVMARWEGALFLSYYLAYTAYLVIGVALRGALPTLSAALRGFAIPITAIVLGMSVARAVMRRHPR